MTSVAATSVAPDSFRFTSLCSLSSKGKKRVYFISNSLEFTQYVLDLICKYTTIVDPAAQLKLRPIKKIEDSAAFIGALERESIKFTPRIPRSHTLESREGFTHRVNIHDILPRAVRLFYGLHYIFANCHGSALVASGAFPILSARYSPLNPNVLEKIPLESIDTGDLVYLESGDHSFVFLNHEICLSMNGRGAPLEIQSISKVLTHEEYGYPEDALKNPPEIKRITILRREKGPNCFEEMMPILIEFFEFYPDLMMTPDPRQHPKYYRLDLMERELREIALGELRREDLPKSTKNSIEAIYWGIRDLLPEGAVQMSWDDAKKLFYPHTIQAVPRSGSQHSLKVVAGVIVVLCAIIFHFFQASTIEQ